MLHVFHLLVCLMKSSFACMDSITIDGDLYKMLKKLLMLRLEVCVFHGSWIASCMMVSLILFII